MSWSVALGVLSSALPIFPSQTAPPPTVPPVVVTVPVIVTTTTPLPDDQADLSLPRSDASPTPTQAEPTEAPGPADPLATSSTTTTPPRMLPDAPPERGPRIGARGEAAGVGAAPRPLLRQPATQLLGAARSAAGDFLPAEAVAAVMALLLVANALVGRRDDLAHVRLDDRDAIVRFK